MRLCFAINLLLNKSQQLNENYIPAWQKHISPLPKLQGGPQDLIALSFIFWSFLKREFANFLLKRLFCDLFVQLKHFLNASTFGTDYPKGWCNISDVVDNMPLSIFLDVVLSISPVRLIFIYKPFPIKSLMRTCELKLMTLIHGLMTINDLNSWINDN